MAAPSTTPALGVASEVGTLRSVIVHRPDLAHERLSPTNCHELLFDDVIWVRRARQEFDAFVDLMRERGVEVLLFHELLTETLAGRATRASGCCSASCARRRSRRSSSRELTAWMTEMPAEELATRLTGGVTLAELPADIVTAIGRALRPTDFVLRAAARTSCSCATRARGSTAASRSTRCSGRRASTRRSTSRPSTASTRASATPAVPIWFGGFDHDWGSGVARGRRHDAGRRRRRARRPGRALERARRQHPRPEPVRRRRRAPGDRRADAARRARRCTSTPSSRSATATSRRSTSRSCREIMPILYRPDGDGGVRARGLRALVPRRAQGRARARRT